jgi:hypothetical protein
MTDRALLPDAAGVDFARLPYAIRCMHGVGAARTAIGRGDVERVATRLARLLAWLLRLPRPGRDQPLEVSFAPRRGDERWVRCFGGRRFASRISVEDGFLVEHIYGASLLQRVKADEQGVTLELVRVRLLGLPVPRCLAPRFTARMSAPQCLYRFEVSVALPLVGPLVRYAGWLAPPRPIEG